ncbi:hypothetical protein L9F63_004879, partial [Diploptera punctata]
SNIFYPNPCVFRSMKRVMCFERMTRFSNFFKYNTECRLSRPPGIIYHQLFLIFIFL